MADELSLDAAIQSGRLDDFIAQAEADGVAAADAELEQPAKKRRHWQSPKQFFIIFSPDGLTPPVVTYQSHKQALGIAWHMAAKHPGGRFFVMGSVSRPCVVAAGEALDA